MNRNSSLPVLARHGEEPATTPIVPLNFVYPGLSISQLISMILAYWKSITIIVFIILAITVVTLKILPRTYIAKAMLMVNYQVSDPINGKNLPNTQLGSYIATQEDLIRSPELLSAVVDRLNLTADKELAAGYNGKTGTLKQWVVQGLIKNLNVNQGQYGSQLIYVTFAAKDPNQAAKIVNAIIDIYKKQDDERAITLPVEQKAYYAKHLSELKKNVDSAQLKITNFNKKHKLDGEQNNAGETKLTALNERLFQAQNQLRLVEASVSENQSISDSVLASPQVQALKAQLFEQRLKLQKMESIYTPQYPELIDLKNAIKLTEQSLAEATKEYSANGAEKLSSARELVQKLKVAVAKQRAKVLSNSNIHDEAANYLLAFKSAQAIYKRALDEYEALRFSPYGRSSNVNIVDHATPPLKYSKPRIKRGLFLGFFLAITFGLGIPFAYELFNRRVRCRDDLERAHGITMLIELGQMSAGAKK